MILWLAAAYLAGSIPFGLLVVRATSGKDVRSVGSGNIGATNVARAAGRGAAICTLVLDALKGLLPVLCAERFAPVPAWLPAGCAFAAVVGHCFPPWLGFRGGKGVATGLGVSLALLPLAALAGAAVWLASYKLTRISSIGSLGGVAVALAIAGFTGSREAVAAFAAVALLILARHAGNIRRLLRRTET